MKISTPVRDFFIFSFKSISFFALFLFFIIEGVVGQTTGDYQTAQSGPWTTLSTWVRYNGSAWVTPTAVQGSPTSASGVITILNTHTVTVNNSTGSINIDQTTINAGGKVILSESAQITVANNPADANDFVINGTYERTSSFSLLINAGAAVSCGSGGTYIHNTAAGGGTIPAISWNANSTLQIDRSITAGTLSQSFGNIIYNANAEYLINSNNNIVQAGATFKINAGTVTFCRYTSFGSDHTATWSGNLQVSGGVFNLSKEGGNNSYDGILNINRLTVDGGILNLNNCDVTNGGSDATLNVNSDVLFSSGTIDLDATSWNNNAQVSNLYISGNFEWSGGVLKRTNNNSSGPLTTIDFRAATGAQTFTQTLGSTTYSSLGRGITWGETGASTFNVTLIGSTGTTPSELTSLSGNLTVNCTGTATLGAATTVALATGIVYMTQGALAGTLTNNGSLVYNGSAAQTVGNTEWPATFTRNVSIENAIGVTLNADKTGYNTAGTLTVKNGSRLNFSTFFIGGSGGFILETGATITSANNEGFGNGSTIGSIRVSGTKTLNNGANYIFNGAVQNSGTIIPTGAGTVNNLTIAASGSVTLLQPTTVTGTLTLSSGLLVTTTANLLTVTNTLPSAITGGNASRYITGPLRWHIGVGNYVFPIGKSTGTYLPFTLATTAASSPIITVEAFNTDAAAVPTINSPLLNISHSEHWLAQLSPGGSFTGSVSLSRPSALSVAETDIAQSTLIGGAYSSIGGTVNGSSINTSSPITALGYFVIGVTTCVDPNTQASGVTFTNVGPNTMKIDWSGSGNGNGVVVVVKAGSAPSDPSDNTAYTASANWSSPGTNINSDGSYVVFNGVGTSVTLTNLSPATNYFVEVFSKNCFGANIKINTFSPANGDQFTLSLEPMAQPASLVASSSACSQVTLTFPEASTITNAAGYLIIQRDNAAPTGTPTDATGYSVGTVIGDGQVAAVLVSTTATSVNINGLATSGTQYHFSIIPFGYNGTNSPTFNYFIGNTIRTANSTISCARYYVNDNVTTGDVYCTAVGNDVNNGTAPGTPKATVTDILNDYKLTGRDTVYIDRGNYTETFVVDGVNADANLKDEGTLVNSNPFSANYLVFKGAGSSNTIFTTSSQTYNVFVERAKYVWLEGISFINNKSDVGTQNILREYGESGVVKSCSLVVNNTSANASYNIYFRCNKRSSLDTKRTLVTSNKFSNNNPSGIGIYVFGDVDFSRFERNTITMTGSNGRGILFDHDSGGDEDGGSANYWPVSDTIFLNTIVCNGNGIECNTEPGYLLPSYLIEANQITVNNNSNSTQSCIWLRNCGISSSQDFKILRNRFMSAYAGVYLSSGVEYTTISNNYFCTRFGMIHNLCDGSNSFNNFIHNSVYTTASCLFFANQCQDWWDIRNNILYSTGSSSSACINIDDFGGTDVYITNGNMFYVPNGALIAKSGSTTYSTLPLWQDAGADVSYISTNDPNSVAGIAPNFNNATNCSLDLKPDNTNWAAGYPNNGQTIPSTSITLGGGINTVSGDIKGVFTRTGWTIGAFDAASQGILPVQLLSFNARLNAQRVLLDWQTASEVNSDYFEVEKSKDGVAGWSFVSRVQSRGNSSVRADYTSIDHKPYGGESYYRLKQVDQDGRVAYSQTRKIINESKTISVYPNPASNFAIVEGLDKNRSNMIHLLDVTGKLISEHFIKDSQYRFNLSKLQPGVYHVVVNGSEHFQLVKK